MGSPQKNFLVKQPAGWQTLPTYAPLRTQGPELPDARRTLRAKIMISQGRSKGMSGQIAVIIKEKRRKATKQAYLLGNLPYSPTQPKNYGQP